MAFFLAKNAVISKIVINFARGNYLLIRDLDVCKTNNTRKFMILRLL